MENWRAVLEGVQVSLGDLELGEGDNLLRGEDRELDVLAVDEGGSGARSASPFLEQSGHRPWDSPSRVRSSQAESSREAPKAAAMASFGPTLPASSCPALSLTQKVSSTTFSAPRARPRASLRSTQHARQIVVQRSFARSPSPHWLPTSPSQAQI